MDPCLLRTLSFTLGNGFKFDRIQGIVTSFFSDRDALARPGSFDPRVADASIGLPSNIVALAEEFGTGDIEEFASFCSVFAQEVAARLRWSEADVSRATEQLYIVLGKPNRSDWPPLATGVQVPSEFDGITAQELAAAKRRMG